MKWKFISISFLLGLVVGNFLPKTFKSKKIADTSITTERSQSIKSNPKTEKRILASDKTLAINFKNRLRGSENKAEVENTEESDETRESIEGFVYNKEKWKPKTTVGIKRGQRAEELVRIMSSLDQYENEEDFKRDIEESKIGMGDEAAMLLDVFQDWALQCILFKEKALKGCFQESGYYGPWEDFVKVLKETDDSKTFGKLYACGYYVVSGKISEAEYVACLEDPENSPDYSDR